jgi:hypothetical protein
VSFVGDIFQSYPKKPFLLLATNLAVIAGVAIAVSGLAGALLVGDSVRGSLKDLFLGRLGHASLVLSASHFFPKTWPAELSINRFPETIQEPVSADRHPGVVTHQESRRRASEVLVYVSMNGSGSFIINLRAVRYFTRSAASADNWTAGIQSGDSVLLCLEAPSDIPAESLHGRKENRDACGLPRLARCCRLAGSESFR